MIGRELAFLAFNHLNEKSLRDWSTVVSNIDGCMECKWSGRPEEIYFRFPENALQLALDEFSSKYLMPAIRSTRAWQQKRVRRFKKNASALGVRYV